MFHELFVRARKQAGRTSAIGGLVALLAGVVLPLAGFTSASTTCGVTDTQCVIAFGDARIAERESALSKLNSRVTEVYSDGHITSDDNSALVADISTNERGLTTLKSTLDSASDAKSARADVRLIYTQFRIYAVVLPRDYHLLWLDMIVHVNTRLTGAEPIVRDAINGAPSGVRAQAQSLFTDLTSQVSTSEAQTQAAQAVAPGLTPEAFDASPTAYATQFGSFKTDIQTASADTKKATSDLHQIYMLLQSAAASA